MIGVGWITLLIVVLVGCGLLWTFHDLSPTEVPYPVQDEPWRAHKRGADCVQVSTQLLWDLADPDELYRMAARDKEKIEILSQDIAANGLHTPLVCIVDEHSDIAVRDGRHRIWIAMHFGIEKLPVVFEPAKKITYKKIPVLEFLLLLGQQ